jgi:hypothetical protein
MPLSRRLTIWELPQQGQTIATVFLSPISSAPHEGQQPIARSFNSLPSHAFTPSLDVQSNMLSAGFAISRWYCSRAAASNYASQ